ncbi:MAG: hypothetical protein ABFR75_06735 [Acidobacteriota bacterium]
MKALNIFVLVLLVFLSFNCDMINPSKVKNNSGRVFSVSHNPSEILSVLQIELMEMTLLDMDNNPTLIYSGSNQHDTLTLNLITLEGFSNLLGSVHLKPGKYKDIVIKFKNAYAIDLSGNTLPVENDLYNVFIIKLTPFIEIGSTNIFPDIIFDVKNSVYYLTEEQEPNGSVRIHPTLIVETLQSGSITNTMEKKISGINGTIVSLKPMSMIVSFYNGYKNVNVTDKTEIEVDEFNTTPEKISNNLIDILFVGDIIKIDGKRSAGSNSITASRIVQKWKAKSM